MACFNKKCFGLTVAWMNIFICILVPVEFYFAQDHIENILYEKLQDNEYKTLEEERYLTDMPIAYEAYTYICYALLPLLIPGILLVIGIHKNYPKLVALWMFLILTLVILIPPSVMHMYQMMSAFGIGYGALYPIAFVWVYLIFCLIPIVMFYKTMLEEVPAIATITPIEPQTIEMKQIYMPIFENC